MLALKKRGFGKGKFTGIGGKPEIDETIEEAVIRETVEEVCVTPLTLKHAANLTFYFPYKPKASGWDQHVTVFVATSWVGTPTETEEMAPRWFNVTELPFEAMWTDAAYWLFPVLAGQTLDATFSFSADLTVNTFKIVEWPQ